MPVNAAVAILDTASVLLILFGVVDPPSFGSFRDVWASITVEGTVQFPTFFALLAAFGGRLAMCEKGISLSDQRVRRHQDQGRLHPR